MASAPDRNGPTHPLPAPTGQETAGVQPAPIRPTPIHSPCIRVCSINPKTSWCEGCYRTLKEIAGWSRLTPDERERIMRELPARGADMAARKA